MARGFLTFRRSLAVVFVLGFLGTGCAERDGAEAVSADAPMLVETSQAFVTFQNRSGVPFTEVSIAILPYGPGEFTRRLSRIENTGRREVLLSEFRGRDGTPLNLRVTRPKSVRVRAQDATGKTHEVQVPWK